MGLARSQNLGILLPECLSVGQDIMSGEVLDLRRQRLELDSDPVVLAIADEDGAIGVNKDTIRTGQSRLQRISGCAISFLIKCGIKCPEIELLGQALV